MIIKKRKKKNIYIYLFFFFLSFNSCYSAFWITKVKTELQWDSDWTVALIIQDAIIYLLWFLALIAVIVVIWAWFTIMTAEGDEEKTKAGKKRITYSFVWILIIFIAYQIVRFVTKWVLW